MDITVEAIEALRVPDAFTPVVGFRRFGIPWLPAGQSTTWCKRGAAGCRRSRPWLSAGGQALPPTFVPGGVSNLWRKRGSSLWGQYGRKERSLNF